MTTPTTAYSTIRWATCFAFTVILFGCSSSDADVAAPRSTASSVEEQPATTRAAASTESATSETVGSAGAADTTTLPNSTEAVCGLRVDVAFGESAPRDRMTITNGSDAAIAGMTFDLSTSVGQIIFDTLSGGDGVEVFQDFQVERGDATLAAEPIAQDGSDVLELRFESFLPEEDFVFSIDVDDRLENSELGQIQVTGSEIDGAVVVVEFANGETLSGSFDTNSKAIVESNC